MPSLQRVLVVAAGLALALLAAPARAQTAAQILDYTVDLQIEAAGTLLVTEQIAYDFATEARHGIFRDVPVRFRYDEATIARLLAVAWWYWDAAKITRNLADICGTDLAALEQAT